MTGFRHSGQNLFEPFLILSAQSTQDRCPHDSVLDTQTALSLSKSSKHTGHVSRAAVKSNRSIWQCPITVHWALPKANNSWYLARSKQCWASSRLIIIHLVLLVESGQPQYHPHPGGKEGQGDLEQQQHHLVHLVHPQRYPHHPQHFQNLVFCLLMACRVKKY